MAGVEATLSQWQDVLGIALKFTSNCAQAYRSANDRTRRLYKSAVFDDLVVRGGEIADVHYRPPFELVFGATEFEQGGMERETGPRPRVPISRSNSFIVWLDALHSSFGPSRSTSSGPQARNDYARGNDFKTRNCDAVEMAVACDQDASATVLGELDQVVVTTIGQHQSRRVDWIGEPDRFLCNAPAKFINLIGSDPVPA